ncbi:MAG: TlpA family protein disulfide reductase [Candidatus Cyclobacteriaceae bacterium M2_1C_046]
MRSDSDYIWAEERLKYLLMGLKSSDPFDYQFIDSIRYYENLIPSSNRFNNYFISWYFISECIRNGGTNCLRDYPLKIQSIEQNYTITNKEYPLALLTRDYLKTPDEAAFVQLKKFKDTYPNSRYTEALDQVLLSKISMDSLLSIINDPALESLNNETVLVNLWASWCGPCVKAIPGYNKLTLEYEAQGFVLLNINFDKKEDFDKAERIIEKKNFSGTHVFLNKEQQDLINRIFYVESLPRKFLYKEGKMVNMDLRDLTSLQEHLK